MCRATDIFSRNESSEIEIMCPSGDGDGLLVSDSTPVDPLSCAPDKHL